jgi:hypothetical protein
MEMAKSKNILLRKGIKMSRITFGNQFAGTDPDMAVFFTFLSKYPPPTFLAHDEFRPED